MELVQVVQALGQGAIAVQQADAIAAVQGIIRMVQGAHLVQAGVQAAHQEDTVLLVTQVY